MLENRNAVCIDRWATDDDRSLAIDRAEHSSTLDIVEIDCFDSLSNITLSHKIYGRGSDDRLIAKAAELARLNPVANTMLMPTRVRAYTAGMLPEVLATRRI